MYDNKFKGNNHSAVAGVVIAEGRDCCDNLKRPKRSNLNGKEKKGGQEAKDEQATTPITPLFYPKILQKWRIFVFVLVFGHVFIETTGGPK